MKPSYDYETALLQAEKNIASAMLKMNEAQQAIARMKKAMKDGATC
jgi:hypothetical protein